MSGNGEFRLRALLAAAEAIAGADGGLPQAQLLDGAGADAVITSLAYDSRRVQPGALFFCVPGFSSDGHEHAAQALAAGAVALVVQRPLELECAQLRVPDVRRAMAPIACAFHGEPSRRLELFGVTGTNGKTTSAMLLRALLEAGGTPCGLLGTVMSVVGGHEAPAKRTTPEAIDMQAQLREMADSGDRACAIEVSSHALRLHRTDGCHFACALFTNLTQDHLDFHRDMDEYFAAKRLLFSGLHGPAVVNVGDPYGARLAAELPAAIGFAIEGEGAGEADYFARDIRCEGLHCSFTLDHPRGSRPVTLGMAGRFNVANALGALAALAGMGRDLDPLAERLAAGIQVPGRLQPVRCGQSFTVLIDYAHTPDSLRRVLAGARETLAPGGRLICIVGAGGDRDRAKRPLMGAAAAALADELVITSDNPRSEQPEAIIAEVLAGTGGRDALARTSAITDRRAAIGQALAGAAAGDVVLVAGKGHERGQEVAGGRVLPFDDAEVVRETLAELGVAGAGAAAGPGGRR